MRVTVEFDAETPVCSFLRYRRNPEIRLQLRSDWLTAVHSRGLDRLPASPGSDWFGDRLLILHVGKATYSGRNELTAHAIWTRGRKPAKGYIAWRKHEHDPSGVAAWAVGRTEADAQAGLLDWPEALIVPRDDFDAFADVSI